MEDSVRTLDTISCLIVCQSVNSTGCFDAEVHRQMEPGIHGDKDKGAYSIVVSGQYKDDKDYGDTM